MIEVIFSRRPNSLGEQHASMLDASPVVCQLVRHAVDGYLEDSLHVNLFAKLVLDSAEVMAPRHSKSSVVGKQAPEFRPGVESLSDETHKGAVDEGRANADAIDGGQLRDLRQADMGRRDAHQGKVGRAAAGIDGQEEAAGGEADGTGLERGDGSGFGLGQVHLGQVARPLGAEAGVANESLEVVDGLHAHPRRRHAEEEEDGLVGPSAAGMALNGFLDMHTHLDEVVGGISPGLCRALRHVEKTLLLGGGDGGAVEEHLEQLAPYLARRVLVVVGAQEAP